MLNIRYLLLAIVILISVDLFSQPCNMSGIYTIGPAGNYPNITSALTALKTNGLGGHVILELKSGYVSTAETFPIGFAGIPCISATRTVTVRPETGASNLQISSSVAGTNISLSNARYITIDGRPGGSGIIKALAIKNLSTSGNAFLFNSDASFNNLSYLQIVGRNTSQTSGVISFLGTAQSVTNGNNNNTISNCDIGDPNENPANCIYALGSTGKKNNGNKILNSNIFNYYLPGTSTSSNGIVINANNSNWEISGNSFYQTVPRGINSSTSTAININDQTSSGFVVQNNFIGGTAPNCAGSAMVYTGNMKGIAIAVSTSGYTNVQGNTISNISWKNYVNPGEDFIGIHLINGKIDCGNISGNVIGSAALYASITATAAYLTSPSVTGILAGSTIGSNYFDTIQIINNTIGGIKAIPDVNSDYMEIYMTGIHVYDQINGQVKVTGNTIGSNTLLNSMHNTAAMSNGAKTLKGINASVYAAGSSINYQVKNIISGNTISNFSGQISAINLNGGLPQVSGNTIKKLPGSTGINMQYLIPGTNISGNVIHSFHGSSTGIYGDMVNGITISGNFIHSFSGADPATVLKGIHLYPASGQYILHGNNKIYNNFIRLGIDSIGNPINQPFEIMGIDVPLDTSLITHNSIHIGGAGQYDNESQAIFINKKVNGFNRITNNILVNNRATPTNPYYYKASILKFDPSITDLNGLVQSNNIYHSTAPNCRTVIYKNNDYNGLSGWRQATGLDSNSVLFDPNFVNAEGSLASLNLHLNNPTPAEGHGIIENGVLADYDNQNRSGFTPVDIGADANNFTFIDPNVVYNPVFCPGGNGSILSNLAGDTYQWQLNTGTGFSNISNSSNYSGTDSSRLSLISIPSSWYGYKFRCVVNGIPGNEFTIKFENRWTGTVSHAWETAGNWSCGVIPDGNTDIFISSGSVILNTNGICRSITVSSGAEFTIAPGFTLTITH